jgi:hypothetical protein
MSVSTDGQNINTTRGDSHVFKLTLTNQNGETYIPAVTDKIEFVVKSGDTEVFKRNVYPENETITLIPDNTDGKSFGSYTCDVILTPNGESPVKVISNAKFIIESEVTF